MIHSFSQDEIRCLRLLAAKYDSGDRRSWFVRPSELPEYDSIGDCKIREFLNRFQKFGLIRWKTNESFSPTDKIADVLSRIDNPPPRHVWNELVAWWFQSRWRTAITVGTVAIPLLVQGISMIRTILEWIGVVLPAASR